MPLKQCLKPLDVPEIPSHHYILAYLLHNVDILNAVQHFEERVGNVGFFFLGVLEVQGVVEPFGENFEFDFVDRDRDGLFSRWNGGVVLTDLVEEFRFDVLLFQLLDVFEKGLFEIGVDGLVAYRN